MRVLYLTTGCFDKGGISRYCRYQISALRDVLGADNIEVLSLLGPDGKGFETPFSVDWHGYRGRLWDKLQLVERAFSRAVATRPNVIHVAHVNISPLAVQLQRVCRAKTLLNVYGLEVWSGLSVRRHRALRQMDRIVADCHATGDYLSGKAMCAREPDVIWDCVDLDRFTPGECRPDVLRKYNLPDKRGSFVVMSLGRLSVHAAHKGYDRLIRTLAHVRNQVEQVHLVIAGQGDDQPRLEALARNLGLADRVSFPGPIDETDLVDVYRAASVFSLVSDRGPGRGEGLPLSPLEAMGCGIPVIVGNQDGSREAVVDFSDGVRGGFVIDPFDLKAHARLTVYLASLPELLRKSARDARIAAERRFGYQRFVEEHRVLYATLRDAINEKNS